MTHTVNEFGQPLLFFITADVPVPPLFLIGPAPVPYFHHLLKIFQSPPSPGEVIKIYFPSHLKKKGGIGTMLSHVNIGSLLRGQSH